MTGENGTNGKTIADETMGIWIAIGAGMGVALGAIFGNIAIGVAFGAGLGVVIGAIDEESRASKRNAASKS